MKIVCTGTQSIQQKSQSLINETMYRRATLGVDLHTNDRFNAIANIQDLLGKIDTFVRDELKDLAGSKQEKINIETVLNTAALPLREIIQQTDPDLLMRNILSQKMNWGMANLANKGPIAIRCSPFFLTRLPQFGFYGSQYAFSPSNATIRLHVAQAQNLPESLQRVLAGRNLEKLDLISNYSLGYVTVADAALRHAKELRYNWVSHPWVFPHAQYGQDLKLLLEMGIFEPIGLKEVKTTDGIPFNALKPLEVHIHPQNGATAMSPNNAHFCISPEMPVSAFWHVMLKDDKTILVHQLIANIEDHPITKLLTSAFALINPDPLTVHDQLEMLKAERSETINRFDRIAKAFKEGQSEHALALFSALKEDEKKWVHFRIWQLMGEPMGIHSDFGRVSFENSAELPEHYYATIQQKAQAVHELGAKQVALRSIHETVARFNRITQAFEEGQPKHALALFAVLSEGEKKWVHFRIWQLMGEPKGIHGDFGRASFESSAELPKRYYATIQQKAQALRELGARQIEAFDQIIDSHLALFSKPHDIPIPSAEYFRKKEVVQPLIEAVQGEQDLIGPLMALKEEDRQRLFAITWEIKGSRLDFSSDFGRLSFLANATLSPNKFLDKMLKCNKQDRLNVLHYFVNNVD